MGWGVILGVTAGGAPNTKLPACVLLVTPLPPGGKLIIGGAAPGLVMLAGVAIELGVVLVLLMPELVSVALLLAVETNIGAVDTVSVSDISVR